MSAAWVLRISVDAGFKTAMARLSRMSACGAYPGGRDGGPAERVG